MLEPFSFTVVFQNIYIETDFGDIYQLDTDSSMNKIYTLIRIRFKHEYKLTEALIPHIK